MRDGTRSLVTTIGKAIDDAMRFFRVVAKTPSAMLLAMLLLFDADLIWYFWIHGPEVVLIPEGEGPGSASFRIERIPNGIWIWVDVLILIAIHVILIFFLIRRLRQKAQPKVSDGA
jgi:hypothetical protein